MFGTELTPSVGAKYEDELSEFAGEKVDTILISLYQPLILGSDYYLMESLTLFGIFEYALVSLALIILSPLVFLVCIPIIIAGLNPFYKFYAAGKNGTKIELYKFNIYKKDSLVESIYGKFLKLTRISRIPLFFNILEGKIRLFGPKIDSLEEAELIGRRYPHYRKKLLIKPGILGLSQCSSYKGINADYLTECLKLDLVYLKKRSILFNTFIACKGIIKLLTSFGRN